LMAAEIVACEVTTADLREKVELKPDETTTTTTTMLLEDDHVTSQLIMFKEDVNSSKLEFKYALDDANQRENRAVLHRIANDLKLGHYTERHADGSSTLWVSKSQEHVWHYGFDYTFDWFSGNIPTWTKILSAPFVGNECHALEIGCFEGLATCWLLEHILTHENSSITVCDTFCGVQGRNVFETSTVGPKTKLNFVANIHQTKNEHKVIIEEMMSVALYPKLMLNNNKFYDLIYIDGSHIAKDVLVDAVCAWKLLKNGGIMIFDDYIWGNGEVDPVQTPKPAIDAFLQCNTGDYDILEKGRQVIIQKTHHS
jgi:hypothetical protein